MFEPDDFALILNYLFYKENVLKAKIEKNKKKQKSQQVNDLTEWYPISKRHLGKIIPCSSKVKDYINYLLANDILITDGICKPGSKSKYYKLNPELKRDIGFYQINPGTRQFEKMNTRCNNKKAHFNRFQPYLAKMKDKIMNMEFNEEKAQEYILQWTDITRQYFLTLQLESMIDERQRLFMRKWNKGRVYSTLTYLKKDFRQFIVGDLVLIDVKNSQPFLLNQLILFLFGSLREVKLNNITDSTNNTLPLLCDKYFDYNLIKIFGIKALRKILKIHQYLNKEDLVNLNAFAEAVNTGMLYDDMVRVFKEQGKTYTRDEMKELMLKVIYCKNEIKMEYGKFEPYEKEKQMFDKVYPVVAKVVKLLKSKNDKSSASLSVLLQNIESKIIIDTAAKELVEAGIVPHTIHDAIVVEREHQQKAIEILSSVYNRFFGTVPRLKIDDFGSGISKDYPHHKIA